MWQLTAMVPMHPAGGRLFVDVTARLAAPEGRAALLEMMGRDDPLIRDALQTALDTTPPPHPHPPPHLRHRPPHPPPAAPPRSCPAPPPHAHSHPLETDPAIVTGLIARSEASVAALEREIRTRTGPALFDFLEEAFEEHKRILGDPLSMQVIMAGMDATRWLNDRLYEWLGRRTPPTPSPCRSRATSPPRWAWTCSTSPTRSARTRRWWRSCRTPPTTVSSTGCRNCPAVPRPATPSTPSSTATACAAPARSTSPGHAGVNTPPRSCPRSSTTSATSNPAPPNAASTRDGAGHGRRNRTSWHACAPCRTATARPTRPNA